MAFGFPSSHSQFQALNRLSKSHFAFYYNPNHYGLKVDISKFTSLEAKSKSYQSV